MSYPAACALAAEHYSLLRRSANGASARQYARLHGGWWGSCTDGKPTKVTLLTNHKADTLYMLV